MLTLGTNGVGVATAAAYPQQLGQGCSLGPSSGGTYGGVLNLQVWNATAMVRLYTLDDPTGGVRGYHVQAELPMTPQTIVYTNIVGFEARDLTAGTHATVFATLTESDNDPATPGGVPLTQTISAGGQVQKGAIALTGIIPASGTTPTAGTGFTYTHTNGSGTWVFTFTTPLAAAPAVLAEVIDGSGQSVALSSITASGFTLVTSGGDHDFNFVVTVVG